jgi:hypothetical protein
MDYWHLKYYSPVDPHLREVLLLAQFVLTIETPVDTNTGYVLV